MLVEEEARLAKTDKKQILEVGCGDKKSAGAVGIDSVPGPLVDVVHDVNMTPWPFKDNTFDEVRLSQIIEHVDNIVNVMREIHRISKNGAEVLIWTPHFSSFNSWTDPTHKYHLAFGSFDLFTEEARYDYHIPSYEIKKRQIVFGKSLWNMFGRILVALSPHIYEKHFCFIFPARDVEFVLGVVKNSSGR